MPNFIEPAHFACKKPVARTYYGMIDSGATQTGALNAAARVYCYHNPAKTMEAARLTVEQWLNLSILQ